MRIGDGSLVASPISMSTNFNTDPVLLDHIANYSLQIVFTGSPVGRFKLQASNDSGRNRFTQEKDFSSIINWSDITGTSSGVTTAGNLGWQVENTGYKWFRLVYTRTSGTGSLDSAIFFIKGI